GDRGGGDVKGGEGAVGPGGGEAGEHPGRQKNRDSTACQPSEPNPRELQGADHPRHYGLRKRRLTSSAAAGGFSQPGSGKSNNSRRPGSNVVRTDRLGCPH